MTELSEDEHRLLDRVESAKFEEHFGSPYLTWSTAQPGLSVAKDIVSGTVGCSSAGAITIQSGWQRCVHQIYLHCREFYSIILTLAALVVGLGLVWLWLKRGEDLVQLS